MEIWCKCSYSLNAVQESIRLKFGFQYDFYFPLQFVLPPFANLIVFLNSYLFSLNVITCTSSIKFLSFIKLLLRKSLKVIENFDVLLFNNLVISSNYGITLKIITLLSIFPHIIQVQVHKCYCQSQTPGTPTWVSFGLTRETIVKEYLTAVKS